MRLSVKAAALAAGIFWGVMVFIITVISGLTNVPTNDWAGYGGTFLYLLADIYPGFNISVSGAFIGLVYGLIDGAIGGAIFAFLYNLCLGSGKENPAE